MKVHLRLPITLMGVQEGMEFEPFRTSSSTRRPREFNR